MNVNSAPEGYLLVDKPAGMTSFSVVAALRKKLKVQKIGHGGTLDPFATGLLIVLVGRVYTKQADRFLEDSKEYLATLHLGSATDSYDIDGKVTSTSDLIPTEEEIQSVLQQFQGIIEQIPPMFSAKKIRGKRLYELARAGKEVERKSSKVEVNIQLLHYAYPEVQLLISCSKGTYVRSLGHEIGLQLGSFAFVSQLRRTRSGSFQISNSLPLQTILDQSTPVICHKFDEI